MNKAPRHLYWISVVVVISLTILVAIAVGRRPVVVPKTLVIGNQGLKIGQKAPDFSLPSLNNKNQISLALANREPMILTFFASWCEPCKSDLPVIESFYLKNSSQIAVIGIDTGDTKSDAISFIKTYHVTFPVAYDPTQELANDLYLIPGMPTTYFISSKHQVLGEQVGIVKPSTLEAWRSLLIKP